MVGAPESAIFNRLTVYVERESSVSSILVADTGTGLPQKEHENLFSALRVSARIGGNEFGLVIVYELVRAHGGCSVFVATIPD